MLRPEILYVFLRAHCYKQQKPVLFMEVKGSFLEGNLRCRLTESMGSYRTWLKNGWEEKSGQQEPELNSRNGHGELAADF